MKLYSFIFYCFSVANIFIYSICFQAITIVIFPPGSREESPSQSMDWEGLFLCFVFGDFFVFSFSAFQRVQTKKR